MKWILFSLLTILTWGIWGIFSKISLREYSWEQIYVITGMVTLISSILIYTFNIHAKQTLNLGSSGFYYAIAAGLVSVLAYYGFYNALKFGKASIVVPFTALYPIITIIMAFIFLNERISFYQGTGIILAIIAMFLFSID
jgi:transporter family protein